MGKKIVLAPLLAFAMLPSLSFADAFVSPFDNTAIKKEREVVYRDVPVLVEDEQKVKDFEIRYQNDNIPDDEMKKMVSDMISQALEQERAEAQERQDREIAKRLESIITEETPDFRIRLEINGKQVMFDEDSGQYMVFQGVSK